MKQLIKVTPPSAGAKGSICFGPLCFTWPDPSIGFKPQVQGLRKPVFPCVMLGGNWGRQLVYEKETQNTYFEDSAPVWWLYPATGQYPFGGGEEICEGFEDRRVRAAAIKYNTLVSNGLLPGEGVEIPASTFRLNDLYMDAEANAFTRSTYLVNLGKQPEGVTIAKIFQANSEESFNTYLEEFQAEGFSGAWVRPNNSLWGDVEYFVKEPLL